MLAVFCSAGQAQILYTNYTFDASAPGWGVWPNGTGQFVSAQWNSSDVNNSLTSGSLLITSTFTGASQQSYCWSGAFNAPIAGALVTNLSCYIRFDPSSPTNSTTDSYGTIEFYVVTSANDSTSMQLPNSSTYYHQTAGNTGWVFYSVPVSTSSGIYGIQVELQTYSDSLTGTSKMYLDDVELTGQGLPGPVNGTSTVDWNNVHQRIDGFGASSAWLSLSAAEGTLLFSTNNNITYKTSTATNVCNGVGLSLLRNHIVFANTTSASATPTTGEVSLMQQAQGYGAHVWSTPWTPAVGFKSTNDTYDSLPITNTVNGGSYLGSGGNVTNVNYANQLANYVASMKNNGINLYAISVQNEPDAQVNTYEACQWNGSQIHDFVTNLSLALSAHGVSSTKIIIPESESWSGDTALFTPTLNDPNTASAVSIVADHDYVANNGVGDQSTPAQLSTSGKALWETEVALLSGSDSSIANGVYYAQRIYQYMTQAQANAYHYWWLVSGSSTSGNEGLLDNSGNITKRLFAFGQYSRFVRPNFNRIDATKSQTPALVSAYKDSASPAFAIVVVNTNSLSDVIQTFNLTNFTATSVTPWVTSATLNLTPQSSVTVTNGSFTYDVPAQSIVTFVGQGVTNSPPVFTVVSNLSVNPGVTVLVTNVATAADVPPYSLTYGAASALPSGATLDPTSGVFSWRPSVSQANSTNQIEVQALDSDSAGLSATNLFSVIVNTITNPVMNAGSGGGNASFNQGQFSMSVNGPQGPDYTLLMSTDLVNWQSIFTTNSPATPFTFTDLNATNANQYYEIQIGP